MLICNAPLSVANPPGWVMPRARFDLDFAGNRYWGGGINFGTANTSNLRNGSLVAGGSAAGVANIHFAPGSDGILYTFPQFAARITPGRGIWAESSTKNSALWCRDLTNAVWTAVTCTVAKDQTGANGAANTASSLTATNALATVLQAQTLASATYVGSAYVKRITGSGTISMTIDGITYTDITASINATGYSFVTVPAVAALVSTNVGFKIATSGDAIAVDFVQLENSTYSTTPMLTTSATVTRGTDEPTFSTTGSSWNDGQRIIDDTFSNTPCSVFAIFSGQGATAHVVKGGGNNGTTKLRGGANGDPAKFGNDNNGVVATSANNGTAAGVNAASGLGAVNKSAGMINGIGSRVCLNGGLVATNTSKVHVNTDTHIGIGNNGAGTLQVGGYISRIAIWNQEITDAEMIEWTTAGTINGI